MRRLITTTFCILSSLSYAQTAIQPLTLRDIQPSMEEMLDLHVEFQEFSPTLVKRSFKVYLEQFDPYKVYLLQEEANSFLHIDNRQIQDVVSQYQTGQYPYYETLNRTIQKSILRARALRQEIEKKFIEEFDEANFSTIQDMSGSYAKDPSELKKRISNQLIYALAVEKSQENLTFLTREDRAKIFALWEKRFQKQENSYLINSSQNNFSLHILKALAKSLDAHTSFFSPQEAFDLRTSLEKQFEGVGIVLREGIHGVVIKNTISGGPAQRSGKITPGDLLVSINDQPIQSLSYEEVLDLLKGERGEKVSLGIQHENNTPTTVVLVREKIIMQEERIQYSYEPCGNGIIGKINLASFYESSDGSSCEKDLKDAIKQLKQQGNLQGLVVDLRENSGGFLNQAVKTAGLFVSSGVIVVSKYSKGEMQYLRDINGRVYFEGPLLLLTSKASASAAEIVAQALQDYGIALVVGDERTYGKGSIQYQTVTDSDASAYFKVTVGKYYTVSGRSTQIEGVKADIQIPTEYAPFPIGEKYLLYPLKNDQITPVYVDPLSDVDSKSKAWMQKNYLPNLQQRLSIWTQMLPLLRKNSQYRLQHDKNFLLFLKLIQNESSSEESSSILNIPNYGQEDLQMTEAVNIIKDMILLQPTQKAHRS